MHIIKLSRCRKSAITGAHVAPSGSKATGATPSSRFARTCVCPPAERIASSSAFRAPLGCYF